MGVSRLRRAPFDNLREPGGVLPKCAPAPGRIQCQDLSGRGDAFFLGAGERGNRTGAFHLYAYYQAGLDSGAVMAAKRAGGAASGVTPGCRILGCDKSCPASLIMARPITRR